MKNKIFLFILLGLFLISFTSAIWDTDNIIIDGLADVGTHSYPTIFNKDESTYLIAGSNDKGVLYGYVLASNGTTWIRNTTITDGAYMNLYIETPFVFYKDNSLYMLNGNNPATIYGFVMASNGTTWIRNSTIVNGLPADSGINSCNVVFNKDNSMYLLLGDEDGTLEGYVMASNGTTWIRNTTITDGVNYDLGVMSRPTIFNRDGNTYMIVGNGSASTTSFLGFKMASNGTTWIKDNDIIAGLPALTMQSNPMVYNVGETFYLINGREDGTFNGFQLPASRINPSITLNSPIAYYNTTNTEITFNITTKDYNPAGTIVNLTLYLDGALNQTNDTICTNCTYNFTLGIPIGKHNWSVLAFNNNSLSNESVIRDFWIKDIGTCNVYFNTTSPITYPNKFIAYTDCNSDYTFYYNGSSISNATTINAGVGAYNISVVRTDQVNYTNIYDEEEFIINTDDSICGVYFNESSPLTFPSQFLVWTNCSSAYTLYRNGSSITNNSAVISGADAYNISVVRTDQQNYSSIFNEEEFRVLTLDDGCAMFFNETTPLEYPGTFTVWTNCSTGTLRRNNTEILNNSEQSLTFGTYNFSFQRTDTANYTTNYVDEYFQITDTIVPTTTIRLPANTTYYTNNITINFSVADNNFANATYNINGTNMTTTSNETQTYITLKDGDYTFYVWAVDGGWATDYDTSSFRVQSVNVTLNSPADNSLTISPTLISCSAETGDAFLKNVSLWNNATGTWHRNETQSGFSYIENFTNVSYIYPDNTYRLLKNISINGDLVYNYSNKVWINTGSSTTGSFFAGFVYSNGTTVNTTVVNIAQNVVGLDNLSATYSYTNPDISKPVLYIEFWLKVTSNNRLYEGFDNVTVVNKTKTTLFLKNITGYTIWNCEYCSNNSNCSFAPSNYSLSIGPIITSYSFSDVYETQQTSYAINVSSNSSLTAATVFLNNTGYDLTNSSGIWNFTRTVPATAGNIPVKYQLTYAGNNYNTTTYYQTINPIALVVSQAGVRILNATAGFTTIYQNYSFKDEENSSTLLGNIPTSTFVYYLGNGTVNKTLTYINSSYNTNYSLAFSPNTLNVSVDPYIQYSASGYPQRVYDAELTNFTNSSTNTTLYLLSTENGMYVTFQVVSAADQLLSGVEMNAYRTIGSVSTNVGTGTTGADGTITLWLNPDFLHTFTFEKEGYTTYSTSFTPTQSAYTITLGGGSSGGTAADDYTRGVKRYIYPTTKELTNDTTYNFIFNVTSSYWDLDSFGFNLRLPNGTVIGSASSSTAGSGASDTINVLNASKIYMDYYWIVEGNYTNGSTSWVVTNSLNTDWSIKTFFDDTKSYMDSGLFGIDNFGRYLIAFLILFLVVGVLGYKYGMTNPIFISALTFGVVFFLDVITGIIPQIGKVPHVITYVAGLIMALVIIGEATR